MIVDAYLKNISAGVDWNLAYEALIKDAENEPLDWGVEGTDSRVSLKSTWLTDMLQVAGVLHPGKN